MRIIMRFLSGRALMRIKIWTSLLALISTDLGVSHC